MSLVRSVRDQLRGNLHDAAALGGLLAGVVALVVLAALGWLPLGYQVLLWGLLLAGFTVVGRLFGPVLFYDLVRSARRMRFVVVRTLYALFIAFILCWMFYILVIEQGWSHDRYEAWLRTSLSALLLGQ